ncbi:MAG: ABC transporter substrate-binding protein [Streptomycetales bacterium]
MSRRWLVVSLAVALLAAGCGGGFEQGGGGEGSSQNEAIKIGVVTSLTGPYVTLGTAQQNGAKLAVDQMGGKAGDHPISIVIRDDQLDPDTALREAQSLVQTEHVDFLVGCVSAAVTLAVNQVAKQAGIPYIGTCQTEQLTRPPHYAAKATYHIAPYPSQVIEAYMPWLCQNLGKKVYLLVPDYAWGHEQDAAYESSAPAAGCEIVGRSWFPLGTTDFTPYIPKVRSAEPDAVIFGGAGRDQVNFMKQANQFGLGKDAKIFLNLEDFSFDEEMGFSVVDNTYAATAFYWGADLPGAKDFSKAYDAAYGTPPSGYAPYLYNAVRLIGDAVAKGQYNPEKFRTFMEDREFTYGLGPQRMRACDHQTLQTTFIVEGLSEDEAAQQGGSAKYGYRKMLETIPPSEEHTPSCSEVAKPFSASGQSG